MTALLQERSTPASIEALAGGIPDTQRALVALIGDYARGCPQKTRCFSDADTFLRWLSRSAEYSQRLESIFTAGMVQAHERHAVFHEAMQEYRSNCRAA